MKNQPMTRTQVGLAHKGLLLLLKTETLTEHETTQLQSLAARLTDSIKRHERLAEIHTATCDDNARDRDPPRD